MSESEKQSIGAADVGDLRSVLGILPRKMSRSDAEAEIRSITRWCRGDVLLPEAERGGYVQRFKDAKTKEENTALVKELEERHLALHGRILLAPMGEAGTETGERAKIHRLIFGHSDDFGLPQCGADVNAMILSEPLDRKDHAAKCPVCGALHTWNPPAIEITD